MKVINSWNLRAAALCGLVLAGCNAVETVNEPPFTPVPAQSVVLQGSITGLGTRRPVVLQNNGVSECVDRANPAGARIACSFLATIDQDVTPFTFGSVPQGSTYDVTVRSQPYGKICTVSNGSGTVTSTDAMNITVNCANDPAIPRYFVRVTVPSTFGSRDGAKVTLTTEEGVFERIPAPGATSVQFDSAVFNSGSSLPLFQYFVGASTTEGGTTNKCAVTNPTNTVGADVVPPTNNVTNPSVGACTFTIGGTVGYSANPATTYTAQSISGLALQLRRVDGSVIETLNIPTFTATTATTTSPFTFANVGRSNADAVYDVAVSTHPAGQHCVVSNGGSAVQYTTGTTNPANITNLAVRCRALPATANQLRGTYQLVSNTVVATTSGNTTTTTSDCSASGACAFRNFMTFFTDGTFLYATHGSSNQVEHGFYNWNPATAQIHFTLITNSATTGGLDTTPGYVGASTLALMGNVVKTAGANSTIVGKFNPASTTSSQTWTLREPDSVDGQMTGTWVTRDHRQMWVYDFSSTYGYHIGVSGGASNMQDACYTLDDYRAPSGYYTRRGSSTGCYPVPLGLTGAGTVDYSSPTLSAIPGFIGRMPGSESAFDGRSPSPIYFNVATPANFAASADATYFPAEDTTAVALSWCTTEVLGVRASLHGVPRNPPVYFCRERAN